MSSDRIVVSSCKSERILASGLPLVGWLCFLTFGFGLWVAHAGPEREVELERQPSKEVPLAMFLDRELGRLPIAWPLDRNSDALWRDVHYSPSRGLRSQLMVEEVARGPGVGGAVSKEEITGLWIDALRRTDRFVVERQQSEVPAVRSAGAYWLEARLAVDRRASLPSGPGLADPRGEEHEVVLGIRLVDGATGQVRLSFESRIRNNENGARAGLGTFEEDAVELVTQRKLECAAHKAAYGLARWLEQHPWHSAVQAIEPGGVRLSAGREHGLEVGMLLRVLAPGELVIDPEGGEAVGSITRPVGRLRVIEVGAQSALAEVLSGRRTLKAGYRVDRELSEAPRDHG